jgi:hypothetical protein
VEALRTVTRGVIPAQLARRGLPTALRTHVQATRPAAEVTASGWWTGRRLEPRVESTLYFAAVDLLAGLTDVRSVELTADAPGRTARVEVVGTAAGEGAAGALRTVVDRLAAFDGGLRTSRGPGGEAVFRLELPVGPAPLPGELGPRGLQALGVE